MGSSSSTMHDHLRDSRMLNRLRSKISAAGPIPRLDVDVDVENGVIELLGVIADEREHDALLGLVARIAASRQVVDRLIISPPREHVPERLRERSLPQRTNNSAP